MADFSSFSLSNAILRQVGLGATICSVLTEQGWTKPLLTVVVVSRCTDGVIVVSDPMNFGHHQGQLPISLNESGIPQSAAL